jgi:DNA-binding MarR family transcriptional regulator
MPEKSRLALEQSPCHAAAMRKASRRLTQLYDEALAPSGLRNTQFTILAELSRRVKDPPTMSQLAESLVMDRSALGHNLGPLERDGLILLEEGEEDRRRRYVTMTSEGKARLKRAARFWQAAQNRFHEVYGITAAATLRSTLLGIAYNERLGTLHD